MSKFSLEIYYDGKCPLCSRYVQYINFSNSHGPPKLIDLRTNVEARNTFIEKGYDPDEGMILKIGQQIYHGKFAVQKMAMLSTGSTLFNKLNAFFLSSHFMASLLYPLMVFGRNLVLEFLGIRNIKSENARTLDSSFDFFKVFAFIYGLYCFFHFAYLVFYADTVGPGLVPISWLVIVLSAFIIWRPWVTHIFSVLIVTRLVEMWMQMPTISNHSIIDFFLLVIMISAGAWSLIRHYDWKKFQQLFVSGGRWLLIIMYVFGIFHKINSDFLNTDVSCAVSLWQQYPFPSYFLNASWIQYSTIYGTFIIEGIIMLGLVFKRTRYLAVVAGISFHLFLGLSLNAYYPAFSMLSIMLHSLFLPETFLHKYSEGRIYQVYRDNTKLIKSYLIGLLSIMLFVAYVRSLVLLAVIFGIIAFPILMLVVKYAKDSESHESAKACLKTHPLVLVFVIMFFLNNAAPYYGLKTQQSLNMFSNLHVEESVTNHLLIKQPFNIFPFSEGSVRLRGVYLAENMGDNLYQDNNLNFVYHDFLALIQQNHQKFPDENILYSFELNEEFIENVDYNYFAEDIDALLLPAAIRKIVHFEGVDRRNPKPCSSIK